METHKVYLQKFDRYSISYTAEKREKSCLCWELNPHCPGRPNCSIVVTSTNKEYWETVTGLTQAKRLIQGPYARRTKDLLKLNRDQLRWEVGLITGHCHLKEHLFKLGFTDDPI
jgi:hypothetical protein